jgi:hypothetical protein
MVLWLFGVVFCCERRTRSRLHDHDDVRSGGFTHFVFFSLFLSLSPSFPSLSFVRCGMEKSQQQV